jgi:hypothetical protein
MDPTETSPQVNGSLVHLTLSKNRFLSSAVWCGFSYFFYRNCWSAVSAELHQTRHKNPTFGPSAFFLSVLCVFACLDTIDKWTKDYGPEFL